MLEDIQEKDIEKVDIIIHELLGAYLLHERSLETVVIARDKFLKEGGKIFPHGNDLCMIPFEDKLMDNNLRELSRFFE